jgi:GxxExxY protein
MLYKITPACSPEVEKIVTKSIGCALRVHQTLGPGYNEGIYQDALGIDLSLEGLAYEREVALQLTYRGRPLRPHRLDLVVEGVLVIELKSVEKLVRVHESQILSYMRAGRYQVGLLMNFNSEWLKGSLRRFVL